MYDLGQGVAQDWVQAYMWYNLADMAGNKTATSNMKIVEAKITPWQVEQAQALAREWLAKGN
jgi:TPR repeat protein